MNGLRLVTRGTAASTEAIPREHGIALPGSGRFFRPFSIAIGEHQLDRRARGLAVINGYVLDSEGAPLHYHRHIERWPGIDPVGIVQLRSTRDRRLAVAFHYYKTDSATGVVEAERRLVLVDPHAPFAYGVLSRAEEASPPTGHEGEADTWYLRGLKLGTIAAGAEVDLETRVRVFLPEEENVATTPSNFSMARMIGGAIGDPLDPYFRERMGIQEVPLPPGFQP